MYMYMSKSHIIIISPILYSVDCSYYFLPDITLLAHIYELWNSRFNNYL